MLKRPDVTAVLLFVALLLVALVAGALKVTSAAGDRARQASVMNIANLVVMVYVAAQAWVFVDMCLAANAIVNPQFRKTSDATLSAPAVTQASAP